MFALLHSLQILLILLFGCCQGTGPSFLRNAVESNNNLQRSSLSEYIQMTFGNKVIPLRNAVEFAIEK